MRNRSAIILSTALSILFITFAALPAESTPGVPKWTASWITCPDAPVRDAGVFHFRKVLRLENVPTHFIVHVSADSQFLLYVNQQRVGSGPARGDLAHWRFETYDLAALLQVGKNVLAATV
jgi:alpha-L-rhamnosidase